MTTTPITNALTDRQTAREVRGHTNRIRSALKALPKDISYENDYRRSGSLTRADLQEIIGSAEAISRLLGIEL